MACPFFMPAERFTGIAWQHRARLPLGDGWKGHCTAPGHESFAPDDDHLTQFCNLGYARQCNCLPSARVADAVRFCVSRDREQLITLLYVCEANHRPQEHGTLEYEPAARRWRSSHSDTRIQRMAECYLESYLERRSNSTPEHSAQ